MQNLSGPTTTAIRKKVSEVVSFLNTYVPDGAIASSGITLTSTDAGASAGPEIDLYRNSASPAASDVLGVITFNGEDSAGNKESYARIQVAIADPTSTTEDGAFQVYTKTAGSYTTLPTVQITSSALNILRESAAAEGPALQMTHISASPAASDAVGMVKFVGYGSDLVSQEYAQISGDIAVATAGAEDGELSMKVAIAGTVTKVAAFNKNGLTIAAAGGYHAISVSCSAQVENDLCEIISTTAVASAALMKALNVELRPTVASTGNMLETARFSISTAIQMGTWANAIVGKIDLTTTGYVTGLAGAVCAEIDLPTTNPAGGSGTYTCFEGELVMPTGFTSTVPVSFAMFNLSGAGKANFDTYGYIFDIQGVADHATGKVFQANNNTATHALRIRINTESYYILLSDTSD